MFELSSKKAIITGAANGINKTLAEALNDYGAELACIDISDEVIKVAGDLNRKGIRACGIKADLTDRAQLRKAFDEAIEMLGTVDILVNGAGILVAGPSEDFSLDVWDKSIELNLTALFEMCQLAGRVMLEKGSGKIINIASLNSFIGTANIAAYCATKGGVGILTKTLADEWSGKGVYVNAIAPGYIETELSKGLRNDPSGYAKSLEKIPLGKWGKPEDLRGPLIFLASSASDYVTGTLLVVDGGVLAR